MASSPIGLRERKRLATERSIETVAVRIAVEEGVEAVTVDRVCDEVMVSRSTFFNYFTSREQAIFGKPLVFDEPRAREILESYGADIVIGASALVIDAVSGGASANDMTRQRMQIFINQPEMTNRISWASSASRNALAQMLDTWLTEHPDYAHLDPSQRGREIRLTIGMAIIVGEEVLHDWKASKKGLPFDLDKYIAARDDLRTMLRVA